MTASLGVSLAAVMVSLVFSMITLWRAGKKEDADSIERQTTVIVKLENIAAGITEIRADMRSVREEIKDHETRLIKLEERDRVSRHKLEEKKGMKNDEN